MRNYVSRQVVCKNCVATGNVANIYSTRALMGVGEAEGDAKCVDRLALHVMGGNAGKKT